MFVCTFNFVRINLTQGPDSEQPPQSNQPQRSQEEWMMICQQSGDLQPNVISEDVDWTSAAQSYPNIEEIPTFIARHRQTAVERVFTTSATPKNLQGQQLDVYTTVRYHYESSNPEPLHIIVNG